MPADIGPIGFKGFERLQRGAGREQLRAFIQPGVDFRGDRSQSAIGRIDDRIGNEVGVYLP
jgi:hypothetical protein